MITRTLLFLSLIVFFSEVHAAYNLTLNVGYGFASSQEMRDKNLSLTGLSQKVKFGVLPGSQGGSSLSEFGVSFANQSFKGNTEHDGVDIEVIAEMSVLEFYYTHYMNDIYLEFGYSRSLIKSDVEGELSNSQKIAVENIYDLDSEGSNSDALRFMLGYKLYSTGSFVISTFGSHTIHQSTTYKETLVGLEFKLHF